MILTIVPIGYKFDDPEVTTISEATVLNKNIRKKDLAIYCAVNIQSNML